MTAEAPPTLNLRAEFVKPETPLGLFGKAYGALLQDEPLGEEIRVCFRGAGLHDCASIRGKTRAEVVALFQGAEPRIGLGILGSAAAPGSLPKALRYDASEEFHFAEEQPIAEQQAAAPRAPRNGPGQPKEEGYRRVIFVPLTGTKDRREATESAPIRPRDRVD